MTYHFVNLISWEFFVDNGISNINKKLKVDSLSLSIMIKLFGYNNHRFSGLKFYNENNFESNIFLVSSINNNFTNSFVLPFWKNINDIKLNKEIISKIEEYENIIIGISSPKQDSLSFKINKIFPNKNIYCLGAAIYEKYSTKIDFLNINWILFLIKKPKRTFYKIYQTVKEILKILFMKKNRIKFKMFCSENNFI